MAVAFDAASESSATISTSITLSHTCSGNDRLLLVFIHAASTTTPSGVTYAGSSMTLVDSQQSSGGSEKLFLYSIANPATGSNNIVASGLNSAFPTKVGGLSFTGTNGQTNNTQKSSHNLGTPGNAITVSSATGNMVACAVATPDGINDSGAGAMTLTGATKRYNSQAQGDGASADGASSVSISWVCSNAFRAAGIGVNIPVKVSGPANVKTVNGLAKASVKTLNGLAITSVKTINGLN